MVGNHTTNQFDSLMPNPFGLCSCWPFEGCTANRFQDLAVWFLVVFFQRQSATGGKHHACLRGLAVASVDVDAFTCFFTQANSASISAAALLCESSSWAVRPSLTA